MANFFVKKNPKKYIVEIKDNSIVKYEVINGVKINKKIEKSLKDTDNKVYIICFESEVSLQTNCNHNYCEKCITEYYKLSDNCPYCRCEIKEVFRINNFYINIK